MTSTSNVSTGRASASAVANLLAQNRSNVVLSRRHGLRLGGQRLISWDNLPSSAWRWLEKNGSDETLFSAPHFAADAWTATWEDDRFPEAYLQRGGILRTDFVKALFVNSFEPGLQFVYPYPPTERLAASLRSRLDFADASVYDPNLEPSETIQAFPRTPLALLQIVADEQPELIIQAVYNVEHDFQLVCALRERAPKAKIFVGGPHMATTDHRSILQALPVDGIIFGDGESKVLELARNCWTDKRQATAEIIGDVSSSEQFDLKTKPSPTPLDRETIISFHEKFPNVWGLAPYHSRRHLETSGSGRILPYDVIGLAPLRVITSQRCGKACFWCRSPKALPPRASAEVVDEIEQKIHSCDSLHFEDNEIWYDGENFQRIGEELKERKLLGKPILVKTTTDQMTPNRAEYLSELGVRIVAFGVESFTQASLDALRKNTTVSENHTALQLTLAAGVKPGINLIWLVPGITPGQTRTLVESTLPYLIRGAYLNLVPELELGDVRLSPALRDLMRKGHVRNEPRRYTGMNSSLNYFSLNLSPAMRSFKERAKNQHAILISEHHKTAGSINVSVAMWSIIWLQAIVEAFPEREGWLKSDRQKVAAILKAISEAVRKAEREHRVLYEAL